MKVDSKENIETQKKQAEDMGIKPSWMSQEQLMTLIDEAEEELDQGKGISPEESRASTKKFLGL